jgi:hypothetical protein
MGMRILRVADIGDHLGIIDKKVSGLDTLH